MTTANGRQYLGRVRHIGGSEGYRYAAVEPVFASDVNGTEWSEAIVDGSARFPKRGFVHWRDAHVEAHEGSLWQFSTEEQAYSDEWRDELLLMDATEPIEVIDLRGWADEMTLRSVMTDPGIALPQPPIARHNLLWLANGKFVGPMSLVHAPDGPGWILAAQQSPHDATRMTVWSIEERWINRIALEGERVFLAPPLLPASGRSAGIQNWSSDGQVARSVLRRLRKIDRDLVEAREYTDKVFDDYLDRLSAGGLGDVDTALERARADRLRGIREAVARDATLLAEVSEALSQSDRVRNALQQEIEKHRRNLLEAASAEVNESLAERRGEIVRLEGEVAEQHQRLLQLDQALREKQQAIDDKVASFDHEVTVRLHEIARRPEVAFAESAILRAALGSVSEPSRRPAGRSGNGLSAGSQHTGQAASSLQARQLADEHALREELGRLAIARDVAIHPALALHATLLAGTTPVLFGSHGYELARLYADAVTGGRLHWVPIGASVLEAQDLLGRFDPALERLIPHPAGILDVIDDALTKDRLHVIVFEGFNRAPIDSWLLPILDSAESARKGDDRRSIPLVSNRILTETDPYRGYDRISWPENVQLICTPADGFATLPIPESAWRRFAVIDADDSGRPHYALPPVGVADHEAAELSASGWRALARDSDPSIEGQSSLATFEKIANEWGLERNDVREAMAVHRTLRRSSLATSDALAMTIATVLLPRKSRADQSAAESLKALGLVDIAGRQAIEDEVRRLSS